MTTTLSSLLEAWPMPREVHAVDIDARWQNGAFIALTVHFVDAGGHVLTYYKARCGSHLWHKLVLPALRTYCATTGLRCVVQDTTRPTAVPRPHPRSPTSPHG